MSAPVQPVVHTPGPWEQYSDWYIRAEGGSGAVALVSIPYRPHVDHDECRANARLIAAAPDLLAALRELVFLKDVRPQDYEARKPIAWQAAREAIAKATGEVV